MASFSGATGISGDHSGWRDAVPPRDPKVRKPSLLEISYKIQQQ